MSSSLDAKLGRTSRAAAAMSSHHRPITSKSARLAVSTASSTNTAGTNSTARSSSGESPPNGDGFHQAGAMPSRLDDNDYGGGDNVRGGRGGVGDDDSVVPLVYPAGGGGGQQAKNKHVAAAHRSAQQLQASANAAVDQCDPRTHLAALTDERSTFGSVSRSCLALNQYAGLGGGGGPGSVPVDDGGMDLLSLSSSLASASIGGKSTAGSKRNAGARTGAGQANRSLVPTVSSSTLTCPSQTSAQISSTLRSLISCCTTHTDRRCRILALRTLASFARSAYARFRGTDFDVNTFHQRDGGLAGRIEDEVANDVAVAMLTVALEEDDDGVSAAALEGMGILVLSGGGNGPDNGSNGRFDGGSDALMREIRTIANSSPSPHCPTLSSAAGGIGIGTDPSAALHELSSRVYSNIVPPRIRRVLHRISLYRPTPSHSSADGTSNLGRALPFVAGAVCHLLRTEPATGFGMDGAGYAKRWSEMDSRGLATELVRGVILPTIADGWTAGERDSGSGVGIGGGGTTTGRYAAALAGLRLVDACPDADWADEVCRGAVCALCDSIRAMSPGDGLEGRTSAVAAVLIGMRGLRPCERADVLCLAAGCIIGLPATAAVPPTVVTAGLPLLGGGGDAAAAEVRRPVRLGPWVELALSVLMPCPGDGDGEDGGGGDVMTRAELLRTVLGSDAVKSVLSARPLIGRKKKKKKSKRRNAADDSGDDGAAEEFGGTAPADEIVFVLCSVAYLIGRRLTRTVDPHHPPDAPTETKAWLRTALVLLNELSPCINWRDRITEAEREATAKDKGKGGGATSELSAATTSPTTVSTAARGSYLRLLGQCMACTNLLDQKSSVTIHMVLPGRTDRGGDDAAEEELASLATSAPLSSDTYALGELSNLMDQIVEYKLREGVSNRSVRVSLLGLLSDHWVQLCKLTLQSSPETDANGGPLSFGATVGMNEMNAREILSMLASEISMLIEEQGHAAASPESSESAMQCLFICIACIENMALAAHEWGQRVRALSNRNFGDQLTNSDEDASYIVTVSTAVLNGQGKGDGGDDGLNPEDLINPTTSAGSLKYGMMEECIYAAKRIQAVVDGRIHGHVNGGFNSKPAAIRSSHSPLVDRERGALQKKDQSTVSRGWRDGWTSSLTLQSIVHPTETGPLIPQEARRDDGGPSSGSPPSASESHCPIVGDAYDHGYVFQYYRQAILSRTEAAVRSSQMDRMDRFSGDRRRARPRDVLRLSAPPPLPQSSQASMSLDRTSATALASGWTNSSVAITGSSDPISLTMAYSVRTCPRYDGEVERRLLISMKMYNVTAVPITSGVRLDLTVVANDDNSIEFKDGTTSRVTSSLNFNEVEGEPASTAHRIVAASPVTAVTAFYKQEVKAGEHLTWAVETDNWSVGGVDLHVSVSFRDTEAETSNYHWVKHSPSRGNAEKARSLSNVMEGNEGGDSMANDEFAQAQEESSGGDMLGSVAGEEDDEVLDVAFSGEPMSVPSSIVLQPCPLVFFRGCSGDEDTFRFLWSSMPLRAPTLRLAPRYSGKRGQVQPTAGEMARVLAGLSKVATLGDKLEGWAFMNWNSKRLLCIISAESGLDKGGKLYIRGDDKALILSVIGSESARSTFVSDLTGGALICQEECSSNSTA